MFNEDFLNWSLRNQISMQNAQYNHQMMMWKAGLAPRPTIPSENTNPEESKNLLLLIEDES